MKKLSTLIILALICLQAQAQTTSPEIPDVIFVEGGTFKMGNKYGQINEKPVHKVTLSSYSIGKYSVTVGQYKKYCAATGTDMPETPDWGWIDNHPIVNVNYYDAVSYCNWLSETYGGDWRLPTEAQWEYAARGGNKSKNYNYSGTDDMDIAGWYGDNNSMEYKPQAVGRQKGNELRIYDMSGNVWEWCRDWYGEYNSESQTDPKGAEIISGRVMRGGSWASSKSQCRVSNRFFANPGRRNIYVGFRVVLSQ